MSFNLVGFWNKKNHFLSVPIFRFQQDKATLSSYNSKKSFIRAFLTSVKIDEVENLNFIGLVNPFVFLTVVIHVCELDVSYFFVCIFLPSTNLSMEI